MASNMDYVIRITCTVAEIDNISIIQSLQSFTANNNKKRYYNLKEYFTDNSTSSQQNSGHVMWLVYWFCYWTEQSTPHTMWHHVSTHAMSGKQTQCQVKPLAKKTYRVQSVSIRTVICFPLFWLQCCTLHFKRNNDCEVKALTLSFKDVLGFSYPCWISSVEMVALLFPLGDCVWKGLQFLHRS